MNNVEFVYLYRDGGNYKKWGRVVFEPICATAILSSGEGLRHAFLQDGLFIASQIRVPEVFLYADGEFSFDDHCYHEFERARATSESADDAHYRSPEFLIRQARRGWQEFDPYNSEGSLGSFLRSRML